MKHTHHAMDVLHGIDGYDDMPPEYWMDENEPIENIPSGY